MSLLDSLTGGQNSTSGTTTSTLDMIGGLITRAGGVQGLINTLQQGGLGGVVSSWVGTGANQPVNPRQLGQALASTPAGQHVEEMAQKLGIDPSQVLKQLSQGLPHTVDQMTPNGQVPGGSGFDPRALPGLAAKLGL